MVFEGLFKEAPSKKEIPSKGKMFEGLFEVEPEVGPKPITLSQYLSERAAEAQAEYKGFISEKPKPKPKKEVKPSLGQLLKDFDVSFRSGVLTTAAAVESVLSIGAKKIGLEEVSAKLETLSKKDLELSTAGIDVEDPKKFSEGIKDPRWIVKGIGQNLPNLLFSIGVAVPAVVVSAPAAVTGGLVFGSAAALEGGFAYNEAKSFGLDDEKAEKVAGVVGIANGILESLPITRLFFRSPTGKKIKSKVISRVTKNVLEQSVLESGTESLQEIVSNAVAKTYNEDKELFASVPEAAFFGGILGGGVQVVTEALPKIERREVPPPSRELITERKIITFPEVKEKIELPPAETATKRELLATLTKIKEAKTKTEKDKIREGFKERMKKLGFPEEEVNRMIELGEKEKKAPVFEKKEVPIKEPAEPEFELRALAPREDIVRAITTAEENLKNTYKEISPENRDKAIGEIFVELETAEKGERFVTPEGDWIGKKSAFPNWIPEDLRSKELFDRVIAGISNPANIKYPSGNKPRQRELYNAILDELDSRLEINTSGVRDSIIENYDKLTKKEITEVDRPSVARREERPEEIKVGEIFPEIFPEKKPEIKKEIKPISKELEPLAQRAKLFKTAGGFVKFIQKDVLERDFKVPVGVTGITEIELEVNKLRGIVHENFFKKPKEVSAEEAREAFEKAKEEGKSWAKGRSFDNPSVRLKAFVEATPEGVDIDIGLKEKELIDFYNQVVEEKPVEKKEVKPIPKEKNIKSLLAEVAQKYDSAEEFIRQFEIHGTQADIIGGKLKIRGRGGTWDSGGIFFTNDEDIAKVFGKNKWLAFLKNLDLLDLTKKEGIDLVRSKIGFTYKLWSGEIAEFSQKDFDLLFPLGEADFATVSQYAEFFEDLGIDGIRFFETAGKKKGITTQIFKDEIPVFTEQELTNLYNQSVKEKPAPLPKKIPLSERTNEFLLKEKARLEEELESERALTDEKFEDEMEKKLDAVNKELEDREVIKVPESEIEEENEIIKTDEPFREEVVSSEEKKARVSIFDQPLNQLGYLYYLIRTNQPVPQGLRWLIEERNNEASNQVGEQEILPIQGQPGKYKINYVEDLITQEAIEGFYPLEDYKNITDWKNLQEGWGIDPAHLFRDQGKKGGLVYFQAEKEKVVGAIEDIFDNGDVKLKTTTGIVEKKVEELSEIPKVVPKDLKPQVDKLTTKEQTLPKFFKLTEKGERLAKTMGKPINQSDAMAVVREYIPEEYLQVRFAKTLREQDGEAVLGRYYHGMIEFLENPTGGVPEHEVVHAYIDLFTPTYRKNAILSEIMKRYKIDNRYDAEEELANMFVAYVRASRTMPFKVLKFLSEIVAKIKKFFGLVPKNEVIKFYDDIIAKKREIFNQRFIPLKVRRRIEDFRYKKVDEPVTDEEIEAYGYIQRKEPMPSKLNKAVEGLKAKGLLKEDYVSPKAPPPKVKRPRGTIRKGQVEAIKEAVAEKELSKQMFGILKNRFVGRKRVRLEELSEAEADELFGLILDLTPDPWTGKIRIVNPEVTEVMKDFIPPNILKRKFITTGEIYRHIDEKEINYISSFFRPIRKVLTSGELTPNEKKLGERIYDMVSTAEEDSRIGFRNWHRRYVALYKKAKREDRNVDYNVFSFIERGFDVPVETKKLATFLKRWYGGTIPVMKPRRLRKRYITHTAPSFWERVKSAGFHQALKEVIDVSTQENISPEIVNALDYIVAKEKFNPYALPRSKYSRYSKNLRKATHAYAKLYYYKKHFDPIVPKVLTMKRFLPGRNQVFITRYLQTVGGRPLDHRVWGSRAGRIGKRLVNTGVRFEYGTLLGLNLASGLGNITGGAWNNVADIPPIVLALGHKRLATKQGWKILDKYGLTEQALYLEPVGGVLDQLTKGEKALFIFMQKGEFYLRGSATLGIIPQEEFKTGRLSALTRAKIRRQVGRTQGLFGPAQAPLLSQTTLFRPVWMFKHWMINELELLHSFAKDSIVRFRNNPQWSAKTIKNPGLIRLTKYILLGSLLFLFGPEFLKKEVKQKLGVPKSLIAGFMNWAASPTGQDVWTAMKLLTRVSNREFNEAREDLYYWVIKKSPQATKFRDFFEGFFTEQITSPTGELEERVTKAESFKRLMVGGWTQKAQTEIELNEELNKLLPNEYYTKWDWDLGPRRIKTDYQKVKDRVINQIEKKGYWNEEENTIKLDKEIERIYAFYNGQSIKRIDKYLKAVAKLTDEPITEKEYNSLLKKITIQESDIVRWFETIYEQKTVPRILRRIK